jgi:hypothetical protein
MPRSREDIETQLRETEQFAERLRICVHRNDPYDSKVVAGLQLRLSDVPAVVAWLNYHFPKTEETA